LDLLGRWEGFGGGNAVSPGLSEPCLFDLATRLLTSLRHTEDSAAISVLEWSLLLTYWEGRFEKAPDNCRVHLVGHLECEPGGQSRKDQGVHL
jgi:hypothetical protein